MRSIKKIVIWLIAVVLLLTPIVYVQGNKKIYARRVTEYLLKEQHYKADEIESVKGIWGKKLPSFYVVVFFKDEPNVEYIYFAHNHVIQFDYIVIGEGNTRTPTSNLKHFDPI